MMLSTRYDDAIRIAVLILTSVAACILALSVILRLTRKPRLLTSGQVLAMSGFFVFIVAGFYGVGEGLWGWPHLRLWLLLLAGTWSVAGCLGLLRDAIYERKDHAIESKEN